MLGRKKKDGATDAGAEISRNVHRYSMEAFDLAKATAAPNPDWPALKAKAAEMLALLPELSAIGKTLPQALHEDVNKALSEARLDLAYVQAEAKGPSSIRMHWFQRDTKA
jgi:hypothetical protein